MPRQFEQLVTNELLAARLTSARLQLGTSYSEDEQDVLYFSQAQLGPVALNDRQQTLGGSVVAA